MNNAGQTHKVVFRRIPFCGGDFCDTGNLGFPEDREETNSKGELQKVRIFLSFCLFSDKKLKRTVIQEAGLKTLILNSRL